MSENQRTNPPPTRREKATVLVSKGWINEGKDRWHHPGFDDDTCHTLDVAWEEQDNTGQPKPTPSPKIDWTARERRMADRHALPPEQKFSALRSQVVLPAVAAESESSGTEKK